MDVSYDKELKIAELAVQRAALLTKKVLGIVNKGTLSKSDLSPVTIADFGAQALLISAIHHNFPKDKFIGEESAEALRSDPALLDSVWSLVSSTKLDDTESEGLLSSLASPEEMLDVINRGTESDASKGRVWVLDPIDGTATFLRGEQYAVCLALLEDGQEKVGVLGCPNLSFEGPFSQTIPGRRRKVHERQVDGDGFGRMVSAVLGRGVFIRHMSRGSLLPKEKIEPQDGIADDGINCIDSTICKAMDLEKHRKIAERVGATWPGTEMWSTQLRYVAMAIADCDLMIRVPKSSAWRAQIWDHAGGVLIFKESGGRVTDLDGAELNFTVGRRLEVNRGLIAARQGMHHVILDAVKEILGSDGKAAS
ncbi:carbohydrate phosphatase [Glonium stellatum]|uniref:3'(2'),5'-bisphosphate nucleotidase n=1 Tax=Glonium stellatum TaxID=574774 RepID=A0A8E2JV74_9PEZI|nr:carbohydrate phosphatase [Glonium stellatum]